MIKATIAVPRFFLSIPKRHTFWTYFFRARLLLTGVIFWGSLGSVTLQKALGLFRKRNNKRKENWGFNGGGLDSESEGRWFKSNRARQIFPHCFNFYLSVLGQSWGSYIPKGHPSLANSAAERMCCCGVKVILFPV